MSVLLSPHRCHCVIVTLGGNTNTAHHRKQQWAGVNAFCMPSSRV